MNSLKHIVREACDGRPDRAALIVLGSGMNVCFAEHEFEVIGEWRGRGVDGHPGLVARWNFEETPVILGLGRRHLYEGYGAEEVSELIAAAGAVGVRRLLVTNAAGGLNPMLGKGDLALHRGYLSVMLGRMGRGVGASGTVGENRSLDHPDALHLHSRIREKGAERGILFREGVYAGVIGPAYETRAEIRMLRRMGADLVGMSTIVEVAAAARYAMTVVGLSLVTNVASEVRCAPLHHDEVTEASTLSAVRLRGALEVCVGGLAKS